MSMINKKKPRKTKLVPRLYLEIDDEVDTTKQLPSIKITDVKSMAPESFETPRSKTGMKTYQYRVSVPKMKCETPETIVSELKTPTTIVPQYETPQAQTSHMPFHISVNVEVEEFDDEDQLQIDESVFGDKEFKMEVDETVVTVKSGVEKESDDAINFQDIVIKQERISPEREMESVDNIEIPALPGQVVMKTEKEDITSNIIENNANSNKNNVNPNKNNVNSNIDNKNSDQFTNNNVLSSLVANTLGANVTNQYTVTEADILAACDRILATSKNVADKILAIEARNIIGSIAKHKSTEHPVDTKIQHALYAWRIWAAGSRRSPPLLYKCYTCLLAWWHLSEFRDHLLTHTKPNMKISLEETNVEECNIISYADVVPAILDIEPKGVCWRCENPYSIHKLSNRQSECYYTCWTCPSQFYSCTALKEHEQNSPECLKNIGTFKCDVCPNLSPIPEEKIRHMQRRHSVRTDLPINTSCKICNYCNLKYTIYKLHNCKNRNSGSQCDFCFRKFRFKESAELHMCLGNTIFQCRICNTLLPKRCMELEHVLMHSTTFIFAYKCVSCNDSMLYLDDTTVIRHRLFKHKQRYEKNYCHKILVPISCILPNYKSPDSATQQAVDIVNEPMQMSHLPLIPQIKLKVIDEEDDIEVKQEPEELVIKEETLSDQEYEDDIIRLSYEHSDADIGTKEPIFYNCKRCPFIGEHSAYKRHLLTKCGTINTPIKPAKVYSCQKCNFQGHHSSYKDHMKIDCSKHAYINEKVYTCTKCYKTFDSLKRYLEHFGTHNYNYMECPVCLANFKSFSMLAVHFNSHIKQSYIKMYSIQSSDDASQRSNQISLCKTCSTEVAFDERFVHWERHLLLKDSYGVKISIGTVSTSSEEADDGQTNHYGLDKEMLETLLDNLQCDNKRFRDCPKCYRNFKRNNDCKRHIIEHLLSDAYSKWRRFISLRCQICGVGYNKADKYKRHMRDHGCLPIFQCEVCDKAFSDSSNFTKHKKVHNMKVLICDICNKKFQAKLSLIKHMEMHQMSQPVTCSICHREFPTDSLFRRHMRTKHDNTLKKNYSCLICKERFYTCKEKWDHSWEVHEERKIKADCPQCGKSFRTYMALKKHDRFNMCGLGYVPKKPSENHPKMITKTFQFDNSVMVFINKENESD